jgi:hypothetical protein
MTAIYQNNFNKVKKLINKATSLSLNFDPRAYPHHEHEFIHSSLIHGLDPWKDSYSSPLIHINLYQVTVPAQINSLSYFLVRDGLFTMIDFFVRCPNPKNVNGILLIHNCLREYVPALWRPKVLFYEFEYRKPEENIFKQKNRHVLIKANVTKELFDYDLAMKKILELKKQKYEKYFFFFFNKSNPFLAVKWDLDYLTIDYVASQSKFINFLIYEKIDYEFLTWKEYFHIPGMQQYDCLDLNFKEKHYIDDFTNYFFIKRGCDPYNPIKAKGNNSDEYIPLSGFHGIRILGKEPSYKDKSNEIFKNLKLMNITNTKCDVGAFQMLNEYSDKFLESAWLKVYS